MLMLKPNALQYVNLHRTDKDQFHLTKAHWQTALITALCYGWIPRRHLQTYLTPEGQQIPSAEGYSLGVALSRSLIDPSHATIQRIAADYTLPYGSFRWFSDDEMPLVSGLVRFCKRGAFWVEDMAEEYRLD